MTLQNHEEITQRGSVYQVGSGDQFLRGSPKDERKIRVQLASGERGARTLLAQVLIGSARSGVGARSADVVDAQVWPCVFLQESSLKIAYTWESPPDHPRCLATVSERGHCGWFVESSSRQLGASWRLFDESWKLLEASRRPLAASWRPCYQ